MLTHEFVHVRSTSLTLKCVGRVLEDLFWYNPLIYIFNRRLDFWSEMACDMECCRDSENVFSVGQYFRAALELLRKQDPSSRISVFHVWGAESFTGAYPPDEAVPKTKRDETTGCFGKFYSGFSWQYLLYLWSRRRYTKKLYKKSMQRLYSRKK